MKTQLLPHARTRSLRRAASAAKVVALASALSLYAAPAVRAQSYTLTTLATFTGAANGRLPFGGVTLDNSGNLYGTTQGGGANSFGTVYKIAASTGTLTTIATFTGAANGQNPLGTLTFDSSGNLYGTTGGGGSGSSGTVFKIATATNTLTTLANFNDANGGSPYGRLTFDSSGSLFGTTYGPGNGTVFKIPAGTSTLSTIATFNGSGNGANPYAGLTFDNSGNLYGTTVSGGANGNGTVFKIAAGTNIITPLVTFTGAANGANPDATLTFDGIGNLYGTTSLGGAGGNGTVFKIATGTGALTTIAAFNSTNGGVPFAGITLDASGNLYGTTYQGGASNLGTVFKVAAGTSTITTLATFTGAANGANPYGGITLDASGNLYGTTYYGGTSNNGTVFKLTATASATPEPAALALLLPMLPIAAVRLRQNAVARRKPLTSRA